MNWMLIAVVGWALVVLLMVGAGVLLHEADQRAQRLIEEKKREKWGEME